MHFTLYASSACVSSELPLPGFKSEPHHVLTRSVVSPLHCRFITRDYTLVSGTLVWYTGALVWYAGALPDSNMILVFAVHRGNIRSEQRYKFRAMSFIGVRSRRVQLQQQEPILVTFL